MDVTPEEQEALDQAARLDEAGRHSEAIDVLAGAAARGGARARAIVGARILVGDRAPALGAPGADLLEDAAQAGDAEAAGLLSVLTAAGAYRPQDWDRALDLLALSAARGWARARGALRALAGAAPDAQDWARLREGIDIAPLTQTHAARTLSRDPSIRAFDGFAAPAVTEWLIARARGRLSRARVYSAARRQNVDGETRTNSEASFNMLETDTALIALQARIAAAAGVPFSHLEPLSVLHYAPGERFAEHFDFIDPATPGHDEDIARHGQRVATGLVSLNDAYEGGRTEFPRLGIGWRGAPGEALLFVNAHGDGKGDVRTVHAGRPVTAGEKWIASQFVRNRPVLPGAA